MARGQKSIGQVGERQIINGWGSTAAPSVYAHKPVDLIAGESLAVSPGKIVCSAFLLVVSKGEHSFSCSDTQWKAFAILEYSIGSEDSTGSLLAMAAFLSMPIIDCKFSLLMAMGIVQMLKVSPETMPSPGYATEDEAAARANSYLSIFIGFTVSMVITGASCSASCWGGAQGI